MLIKWKLPESGRHTGPTAREKAMVSLSWTRAMSLLKDLRPNFGCLITLTMDRSTIRDSSTCVRSWAPRNTWIESKSNLRKDQDAIWLVLVFIFLLKHLHIYVVCFYLETVVLELCNNFEWIQVLILKNADLAPLILYTYTCRNEISSIFIQICKHFQNSYPYVLEFKAHNYITTRFETFTGFKNVSNVLYKMIHLDCFVLVIFMFFLEELPVDAVSCC